MFIDPVEYQKVKYIAFIDVLGFSDIVNNIEFKETYDKDYHYTDNDKFHVVQSFYNKILNEIVLQNIEFKLEITSISDCIIVSTPYLGALLEFLFILQSDLIYNSYDNVIHLLRGYLTRGCFIHNQSENLIFGEAYQRAVKGEKDTKYPRIEIDKTIMDLFKEKFEPYDVLITQDKNDSAYFINYLIREKYTDMFERIRIDDFITKNLNNSKTEGIAEKYKWLQEYYNDIRAYRVTPGERDKYNCIFPPYVRDI